MRCSASSHVTRGGRGSWNASATASNQPPIFICASSVDVVGAIRPAVEQRRDGRAREIVGMDVVGEHVVVRRQHRRSLADPVERQPRLRVDSRRAQDRELHAMAARPGAQPVFGGDPPPRARRLRAAGMRFGHLRARAIAVDARRGNVDEALRYNPRPCQRRDELLRARIVAAVGRRRRKVQDREGRGAQAAERCIVVEVAGQRNDAVRAQLRCVARRGG